MNTQSFVFYESVAKQAERLAARFGKDVGYDLVKAVWDFGLYGVVPDEDSDIWLYGLEQIITSIDNAKNKYNRAIENGKKGGRPKGIDEARIKELKEQGLTNREVAEQLGCSEKSVERVNIENRQNRQNLNVNENENENENGKEKEKEKENTNINVECETHTEQFI